jgi:hypothetical protein
VAALNAVLRDVATMEGVSRVYVVAHSMGNRLLVRALEEMASMRLQMPSGRNRLFTEIVFASPDVGRNLFEQKVAAAQGLAGRLTLYASNDDRALHFSWLLHRGEERAGQARAEVLLHGLDTVDTSAAQSSGFEHDDFVGPARDDLRGLLWFSMPTQQRCLLTQRHIAGNPVPMWRFAPPTQCGATPFRIALSYLRRHDNDFARAQQDLAVTTASRPAATRPDYEAARRLMAGWRPQ